MKVIIARLRENIEWIGWVKDPVVVQKGIHCPDYGREASTYLWFIIHNYDLLEGEYVFCQGNPFDHCKTFIEDLETKREFGPLWKCDGNGTPIGDNAGPIHPLPILESAFELGLPRTYIYPYVGGAQFKVSAACIKKRPCEFYRRAYEFALTKEEAAWILERLWFLIFPEPRI